MKIGYRQWLQMERLEERIALSVTGSGVRLPVLIPASEYAVYKPTNTENLAAGKNSWDLKTNKVV